MLDIALHSMSEYPDGFDLSQFEKEYLEKEGMPQGIIMRHRLPHFLHLFASSSYASGYVFFRILFLFHLNTHFLTDVPYQTHIAVTMYTNGLKCLIMMCLLLLRRLEMYSMLKLRRGAGIVFTPKATPLVRLHWLCISCFQVNLLTSHHWFVFNSTSAPQELFQQFRGRDPEIKFLLKNRGLV